jgi:hypothetical protein
VCVWVYFYCCSVGDCVRDSRRLELCKVDIVGCSAGGECVEGSGSLVTGWGRIGGGGKGRGREWMRRGRKNSQEGEQWIAA